MLPSPENPAEMVVFELFEANVTIMPVFERDTVRVRAECELVGSIAESIPMREQEFSGDFTRKVAKAVEEEYTSHAYAALKKIQSVKADTIDLGGLIYRKNPQYWEKIKDRWEEEIFPTVEADVKINVTIKVTGMTR